MAFYDDWGTDEWWGVAFIVFVLLALVAYVWLALRKKPPAEPPAGPSSEPPAGEPAEPRLRGR